MQSAEAAKVVKESPTKTKRKRRCSKNDTTPRSYECGCGRGYYSYPALYTHMKPQRLKHDGQSPDGTKIPFDKHYGTRGRPREKKVEQQETSDQEAYHSDQDSSQQK